MKRNGLTNKKVLGVSGQSDILRMLEDRIKDAIPDCRFDKVATPEEARLSIIHSSYNLLIMDEGNYKRIARTRSSFVQNLPLLVLTDNGNLPAVQKNSFAPDVCAYHPASRLEEIIPILSRLLSIEFTPHWQRPFKRYGGIFNIGTVEAGKKLFKNGGMKDSPKKAGVK